MPHSRTRKSSLGLAWFVIPLLLSLSCQTLLSGPTGPVPPAQTPTHTPALAPEPVQSSPTPFPEPQLSATSLPPTSAPPGDLPLEGASLAYPGQVYAYVDPPVPYEMGSQVKDRLEELGYEICHDVDWSNSPFYTLQTAYAVRHFQEVNGLEANGTVDEATWNVLFAAGAQPAPAYQAESLEAAQSFYGVGSTELGAAGNGWLWLSARGFGMADAFDPNSPELYAGMYALLGPADEGYTDLQGLASDGETLWAAFQGSESAVLQAYDPSTASPVEGMLNPLWAPPVAFDSFYVRGLSYGGGWVWAAVEAMGGMHLVRIDPLAQAMHSYIEMPVETFPNAPAYDENLQVLWAPVQGMYGDYSILAVDPDTGPYGDVLGVCGSQAAYVAGRLWVAQGARLLGVDTASRQVTAVLDLDAPDVPILTLIPAGDSLWVVAVDGMISQVVMP